MNPINSHKDTDIKKLTSHFTQKPLNDEDFNKLYTYLLDHPTLWDYIKLVITRYRMTRRFKRCIRDIEPLSLEEMNCGVEPK